MNDVTIEWEQIEDTHYLRFKFFGKLTKEIAEEAIKEWEEKFQAVNYTEINLIWDCLEMSGYQPASASLWKTTMNKHKDRIGKIWVISDNPLIRMGARAVTMITNLKLIPVSAGKALTP